MPNANITIKIATMANQEEKILSPEEALEELKRQRANGMWMFVNGQECNIYDLSLDDLIEAEDITLMYEITGG